MQDAGALAEELDRADARAGAAEQVLGEDRSRAAALRLAVGDRGDEGRHVDVGGARDDARAPRVGPPHSRQRSASTIASPSGAGPELLEDRRPEVLHPVTDAAGPGRRSHRGGHGRGCGKLAAARPQIATPGFHLRVGEHRRRRVRLANTAVGTVTVTAYYDNTGRQSANASTAHPGRCCLGPERSLRLRRRRPHLLHRTQQPRYCYPLRRPRPVTDQNPTKQKLVRAYLDATNRGDHGLLRKLAAGA